MLFDVAVSCDVCWDCICLYISQIVPSREIKKVADHLWNALDQREPVYRAVDLQWVKKAWLAGAGPKVEGKDGGPHPGTGGFEGVGSCAPQWNRFWLSPSKPASSPSSHCWSLWGCWGNQVLPPVLLQWPFASTFLLGNANQCEAFERDGKGRRTLVLTWW